MADVELGTVVENAGKSKGEYITVGLEDEDAKMEICEVSADKTTYLHVSGICCPAEAPLFESLLEKVPGVTSVKLTVPTQSCIVKHSPTISVAQIIGAFTRAGIVAREKFSNEDGENVVASILPKWNLCIATVLWIVSLFYLCGGFAQNLIWLALPAALFASPTVLSRAITSAKHCNLDMNVLIVVASFAAIIIGDYTEGAAVVVLFGLSEFVESRATASVRKELASLLSLQPSRATLASSREQISADDIKIGEHIAISAGEKTATDGVVISGTAWLNQSIMTGESVPIKVSKGSRVSAGATLVDGHIVVKATALAEDSAVSKLVALVGDATSHRSKTQQLLARTAKIYTPVVVVVALLVATIPWMIDPKNTSQNLGWVRQGLVLLIIACPCALLISTPVAYVCAIAAAAKNGILSKGGEHLEALTSLVTVAFDKTGTLTHGDFKVTHFEFVEETQKKLKGTINEEKILEMIEAVELCSSHPIAKALSGYARGQIMRRGFDYGESSSEEDCSHDDCKHGLECGEHLRCEDICHHESNQDHGPKHRHRDGHEQKTNHQHKHNEESKHSCGHNHGHGHKHACGVKHEDQNHSCGHKHAHAEKKDGHHGCKQEEKKHNCGHKHHHGHKHEHDKNCGHSHEHTHEQKHDHEEHGHVCKFNHGKAHGHDHKQKHKDGHEHIHKCNDVQKHDHSDEHKECGHSCESFSKVSNFHIEEGLGVSAKYQGMDVLIGNAKSIFRRLSEVKSLSFTKESSILRQAKEFEAKGGTFGVVCVNGSPIAIYCVSDSVREEAKETIEILECELGCNAWIVTGDNRGAGRCVADAIRIDEDRVMSDQLPRDKVHSMQTLRMNEEKAAGCAGCRSWKNGVGLVGDGINDAPALRAANVGFAMGASAAAVAMETADIVILDSNLLKVVWTMKLARALMNKIRQNISFSLLSKVVMMGLVSIQLATLWMAILVDIGTMLLVTFNSTRLLLWEFRDEKSHDHHSHSHSHGHGRKKPSLAEEPEDSEDDCSHSNNHGHAHGNSKQCSSKVSELKERSSYEHKQQSRYEHEGQSSHGHNHEAESKDPQIECQNVHSSHDGREEAHKCSLSHSKSHSTRKNSESSCEESDTDLESALAELESALGSFHGHHSCSHKSCSHHSHSHSHSQSHDRSKLRRHQSNSSSHEFRFGRQLYPAA